MRFKTFLQVTVAALPIVLAGCADSTTEIRARYGDTSWTAGELTSSPYERGTVHFTAGRYGLAVKQFEIASAQNPDSVEALNGLAASFDRMGRFELSERYYLRALNLEPENTQTLNNLGFSYLMQGRYDLAMTYLNDALAQNPMDDRVRDNLQQAEASLELESRNFLASAVGSAEFLDVAAPPRFLSVHTQMAEAAAPSQDEASQDVRIRALADPENIWIERRTAVVQSLVTQPSPDLLAAMREAGLAPRIGNFRNQAAVTALQTQPAPWQSTHIIVAEAMAEREQSGAIRQDRLTDDGHERPRAAPTVDVVTAELPHLSATVIEEGPASSLLDLPQLAAAMIEPDVVSDVEPDRPRLTDAAVLSDEDLAREEEADEVLGDLRQLSAALIGGEKSPADGEGPEVETETPIIRQESAVTNETMPQRSASARNEDLPDLPSNRNESPVIEVSNGTGRPQMAHRISQFLQSEGLSANRLTNAKHFRHQETVIFYRGEWLPEAKELAARMPVDVRLEAAPNQTSDIRIRLGGDLLNFDQELFYANRESSFEPTG